MNLGKPIVMKDYILRLKDRLNRLKRKTKGYSKNINVLIYALAIVFSFTNIPTDFGYF